MQLRAPVLRQGRDGRVDGGKQRGGALRVVYRAMRRHLERDILVLHRGVQVHLLRQGAQARAAEYQLRVNRRLKGHGALMEGGIAPQHGEVVPAPGHQLYVLAAPMDEVGKHVGKRAAGGELLLGHAGHLFDVLVQALVEPGLNQAGEGIHDPVVPVHAARADLDDLVRHAVVRVIAALVPFQIKDDEMAARAACKRKHGPHPVKNSCASYCNASRRFFIEGKSLNPGSISAIIFVVKNAQRGMLHEPV